MSPLACLTAALLLALAAGLAVARVRERRPHFDVREVYP